MGTAFFPLSFSRLHEPYSRQWATIFFASDSPLILTRLHNNMFV